MTLIRGQPVCLEWKNLLIAPDPGRYTPESDRCVDRAVVAACVG